MKEKKRTYVSGGILVAIVAVIFTILTMTSCSDDKSEPTPDYQTPRSFLDQCVPVPFAYMSVDNKALNLQRESIDAFHDEWHTYHWKWLSGGFEIRCAWDNNNQKAAVEELREKYNDFTFKGNRSADMFAYKPLASGLSKFRVNNERWSENDGDINDHITIRYMSFHEFLSNGYKWPEGVTGPWKEKTLSQFNAAGGDPLIHSYFYLIPDEEVKEKCYDYDLTTWDTYTFGTEVVFGDGSTFPNRTDDNLYYWGLPRPTTYVYR